MLKEGFLAGTGLYPTLAHNEEILAIHREAMDRTFAKMAAIVKKGGKEAVLETIGGPVYQTGFKRLID